MMMPHRDVNHGVASDRAGHAIDPARAALDSVI